MSETEASLQADVRAVGKIDAVPTILEVICRSTGMGFAAVARVSDDRWIACAVRDEIAFGLKPGGELKVETTICDEIRNAGKGVVIDEVATDAKYCGHPTPAMYGFQSYISIPIWRADKTFFGTLCAIDPRPAKVNRPEVIATFELFAQLIATQLELQDRFNANEAALIDERSTANLREQFIAVLGHDLRNPLASIDAGVRVLRKEKLSTKASGVLDLLQKSSSRIGEMIENVLDLARARLGGGIQIELAPEPQLADALRQVVAELQSASPDREIETTLAIDAPVVCNEWRVSRLLSNLLGNAIAYGAADKPIRVAAFTDESGFQLSVANQGQPIPPATAARIFQPFFRAEGNTSQGLGLGLYIASEIARAHGGVLELNSSPAETRFTFRLPRT